MASFLGALQSIAEAGAAIQKAQPDIVEFSQDHATGTQALLMDAANAYAATTTDPAHQSEAVATAQLASAFVPMAFSFFGWLKNTINAKKALQPAKA